MWTRSRFVNEYVPGLFAVAVDAYTKKRGESKWPKLFDIKTSKKKKEENTERTGLGLPVLKGEGGPVTYDTEIAGPKQAWVHSVFALAVRITEEAVDDNLYELGGGGSGDELKEIFKDLGESMEENLETLAARFLVTGSETTYHGTREATALPLFDSTHYRIDGSTFDNEGSGSDLTYSTFWTAIVAAENQQNNRQFRIQKKVRRLYIPPVLEKNAREILFSPDRPDTANRAISAYANSGRNIELVVWQYLTDLDAWYMQLTGRGLIFFWRRMTRFAREREFQTGDMMCKADQRFSAEIDDAQGWWANIP
ncbi:MAG: hypothetical protein KAX30_04265 [Candidatus Atribacteria bacterium]|nr:hypothetical protein [Candidatus Atribacteria bacterium]